MKHYNVKILMIALLSTAFSLTAGAQGYYAYATGDYTSIDINTDINPSTADNISVVYGGFNDTETPANSDTYKTGDNRGDASYPATDYNKDISRFCKGNNVSPKNKNGNSYSTTNKLPPVKGTFYILKPKKTGVIRTYVSVNASGADRTVWICKKTGDEQITPVTEYPSGSLLKQNSSRYYVFYQFNVEADTDYFVFATNVLGFAGFIYTTEETMLDENEVFDGTNKVGKKAFQLKRSFVKDKWNTLCIPCSLTVNRSRYVFGEDVEIAIISGNDDTDNGFKFSTVSSILPGRVYLVKPSKEVSDPLIIATITNDAAISRGKAANGYFRGTYSPVDMTNENSSYWFLTANGTLSNPSKAGQLKGFRCYFDMTTTASSRPSIIWPDGETTEISELVNPNTTSLEELRIYNLSGQRVTQPTQGLYIMNGKKIIIK